MSKPTHLMPQSFFSFDLIFTDQLEELIVVSPNFYIVIASIRLHIAKLNFNIKYRPLHKHLVWDYNKANVGCIKKSIDSVNWTLMFSNYFKYDINKYVLKLCFKLSSNI